MKIKPLVERFSGSYWKSEIQRAKERSKKFVEAAEESIRVYNAQKQVGVLNDAERRLNSWWYCVNTLLPAYYSSTPKAEVTLRKRAGGTLEEVSAVVLERNIQYALDNEFPFDLVGYTAALHFLLTGRAVLWARYDVEIEQEEVEIALFKAPDGTLLDDKGQPFTGDTSQSKPGPGGLVLVTVTVEKKDDEKAVLDVVAAEDYLCSDARNETEVEWRSRRAYLSRAKAEKVLGKEIADNLSYDSFPDKDKRQWHRDDDKFEGKAELWEIWCEESETVYWLHPSDSDGIVYKSEPPIEFEGFYPCSVIAQSQDPDSVLPVSDYSHVKDQILEVERLTTRIHAVTQAIRTNALYDSTLGTQIEQLMSGDLKLIPTNNWPSYKSRGGLAAGLEIFDIAPYVNALQVLQTARQTALEQLYETLKVSDLLRGSSDQYKSATANRLEQAWSSLGLIVRQNMFTKFISDAIDKLGQIIASQFDAERIFEVGDVDRLLLPLLPEPTPPPPQEPMAGPDGQPMMAPPPPPPPSPEMMMEPIKQQIIELFRDEDKRCYKIKIASDSMIAIDQAQDQAEGSQLMSTAGEFFNQMRGLIEQYPPLLGFSIELFQNVIKRFKGGKELDGIFTKALGQIGQIAQAKEEAAKQPPPPDPIVQEMQGRLQIAQIESQTRLQQTQMEAQDRAVKNQLEVQAQQMRAQTEQLNAQLKVQEQQFKEYVEQQKLAIAQQEAQVKAQSVQVDLMKVEANAKSELDKTLVKQETSQMTHLLEVQKLELENMRIRLAESEKLLEERRLAQEQDLERVRLAMEHLSQSTNELNAKTFPPKPKRKMGKIVTDAAGNPIAIEVSEHTDDGTLIGKRLGTIIEDATGNPSGINIEDLR